MIAPVCAPLVFLMAPQFQIRLRPSCSKSKCRLCGQSLLGGSAACVCVLWLLCCVSSSSLFSRILHQCCRSFSLQAYRVSSQHGCGCADLAGRGKKARNKVLYTTTCLFDVDVSAPICCFFTIDPRNSWAARDAFFHFQKVHFVQAPSLNGFQFEVPADCRSWCLHTSG